MATLQEIREGSNLSQLVEGQAQHLLIGALLVIGALSLMLEPETAPKVLGLTSAGWAKLSIALAVVHQIVVAMGFRLQLHHAVFSRWFGPNDLKVWTAIFMPLLAARPITLVLAGLADPITLTDARGVEIALGGLLLLPALWGMHGTLVHFTLRRAVGGDHFRDDIRTLPPVKEGVFKYTDNGMYGVVFLGLWGIALGLGSWNALVVAAFQHAYIWVHMYTTEAPDMRRLYGATA